MSDDPLLRRLAQAKREEQEAERAALDERWDRLSAGELSPEEEAELRALAGTSDDARQAYEAFRPLGPEFQARMVRTLQEQGAVREPDVPEPRQPGRVLPFRRLATRLGGALAAAAAVAAVAVLLLRDPGPQPPLPGYKVELSGDVQEMRGEPVPPGPGVLRGEPGPLPTFRRGSRFELIARPSTAVSGQVAARFFLGRGQPRSEWPVAYEISPDGVVWVAGTVGSEIKIPSGKWTLWVVVGRPGKLPNAEELSAHLSRPPPGKPDWVVVRSRLRIE